VDHLSENDPLCIGVERFPLRRGERGESADVHRASAMNPRSYPYCATATQVAMARLLVGEALPIVAALAVGLVVFVEFAVPFPHFAGTTGCGPVCTGFG
jgi:hypothetical protein